MTECVQKCRRDHISELHTSLISRIHELNRANQVVGYQLGSSIHSDVGLIRSAHHAIEGYPQGL